MDSIKLALSLLCITTSVLAAPQFIGFGAPGGGFAGIPAAIAPLSPFAQPPYGTLAPFGLQILPIPVGFRTQAIATTNAGYNQALRSADVAETEEVTNLRGNGGAYAGNRDVRYQTTNNNNYNPNYKK